MFKNSTNSLQEYGSKLRSLAEISSQQKVQWNHNSRSLLAPILLTGLILVVLPCYASLSTSTAKTIQGREPELSFDNGNSMASNLDYLLSFEMPDGAGDITVISPTTNEINVTSFYTFEQFVTKVSADGIGHELSPTYYYDTDGDTPHLTTPVAGSLTATWSYVAADGTTKIITADELSEPFNGCNAPYTLTITANDLKALSAYGDPMSKAYDNQSTSYTVNVTDYRICYARPAEMTVISNCSVAGNCTYESGYNPSVFTPGAGFSPNSAITFPTTGFDQAEFRLVMSSNQSDYIYTSSNPAIVSIDGNGDVTLHSTSKPVLPLNITLTATPNDTTYPAQTYSFSIVKWARALGESTYANSILSTATAFPAASMCKDGTTTSVTTAEEAETYFFARSDFTNTPKVMSNGLNGYFTRDIDSTFMGEWGNLYGGYPAATGFKMRNVAWASESRDDGQQFGVNIARGQVGVPPVNGLFTVVCR
ncbi:hypothetical protein [Zophobihabitans entericus]|uniref:Uncharacterized protein n=1 Tax=Zophobihabitans entericus TaxID=1635327 RepID=A0A6G9IBR4_9GAMM|nr:hypothetical protein [Zophobihabitans entericus]QIQ21675.1 hypothetical protein IPMB12_08275 [Zophobihabitans entericus]